MIILIKIIPKMIKLKQIIIKLFLNKQEYYCIIFVIKNIKIKNPYQMPISKKLIK